ncbi:APC family permease [Gulosibacter sediminis]|uniref:APC family permease n=1 Tax=Gulosibacter sediminis TaxID=1729695 RepID=UPI0024ACEA15|nr:APC family permease [Gulosibacter sediminis]
MTQPALERKLGLFGAMSIGLAAMIGAGVFSVFGPAARVAGEWLLLGLALALLVAACNATSTAQLSAKYPTSGGAYHFGSQELGAWPGFIAGWGFVIGKTASAAAMALTLGAYLVPDLFWQRAIGLVAVALVVVLNLVGITRTARAAAGIVTLVLTGLAVMLIVAWTTTPTSDATFVLVPDASIYGVLQSAGLMFFAFAGYARIATLGEEVRDPTRVIPRAIITTLVLVAALYVLVAVTLLARLGPLRLAASDAPLVDLVSGAPGVGMVVVITATLACLGALLAGVAGITRTGLAMARNHDLPVVLSRLSPSHNVPALLTIVVGVAVAVLILIGDIRDVIGFSSVGVLVYYLVANLSALHQRGDDRRYPKWMQLLGAALCAVLVVTLPVWSVVGGLGVLALGVVGRLIFRRGRASAKS